MINPDAHVWAGFEDVRYGVAIARKGWLTAADVLNTLDTDGIRAWLRDRTPSPMAG
jgi:DNA polymerase (family 10)